MLQSEPPFYSADRVKMAMRSQNEKLQIPTGISKEAEDFLNEVCYFILILFSNNIENKNKKIKLK
mgnify:CR=1 FL=1